MARVWEWCIACMKGVGRYCLVNFVASLESYVVLRSGLLRGCFSTCPRINCPRLRVASSLVLEHKKRCCVITCLHTFQHKEAALMEGLMRSVALYSMMPTPGRNSWLRGRRPRALANLGSGMSPRLSAVQLLRGSCSLAIGYLFLLRIPKLPASLPTQD